MNRLLTMLARLIRFGLLADEPAGGGAEPPAGDAPPAGAEPPAGNEPPSGDEPPAGGDLTVALRQAREEARAVKAQLKELQEAKASPADAFDITPFAFSEDDLVNADVASLNTKLTGLANAMLGTVSQVSRQSAAMNTAAAFMAEHAIFDDPDMAEFAAFKASEARAALPATASVALIKKTISDVAKQVSALKAASTGAPPPEKKPPSQPGGGGADAAHLRPQFERPKSVDDARALTDKIFGE